MSQASLKTAFSPLNNISKSFTKNLSESSFGFINNILENDWLRSFLLLVVSVYAGYTLQPVPNNVNNLFNTSTAFKYLVLFVLMLTSLYPLDNNKVILSIVVPIALLVFFEFLRKNDKKKSNDDEEESSNGLSALFNNFRIPSMKSLFSCNDEEEESVDVSMPEEN